MSSNNLLSIIMVAYNEEEWLEECFESLLKQTSKDFEVIFIDNNSSDDTYETAIRYRKVFSKQGLYMNVSKNKNCYRENNSNATAMQKREGALICFMSVRTRIKPDYVEHVLEAFEDQKVEAVIVPGSLLKHQYEISGELDNKTLCKYCIDQKIIKDQVITRLTHRVILGNNYLSFDGIQHLYDIFIFGMIGKVVVLDRPYIVEEDDDKYFSEEEEKLILLMEVYRLTIGMEEKAKVFHKEKEILSRQEMNRLLQDVATRMEEKAIRFERDDIREKYKQLKMIFC